MLKPSQSTNALIAALALAAFPSSARSLISEDLNPSRDLAPLGKTIRLSELPLSQRILWNDETPFVLNPINKVLGDNVVYFAASPQKDRFAFLRISELTSNVVSFELNVVGQNLRTTKIGLPQLTKSFDGFSSPRSYKDDLVRDVGFTGSGELFVGLVTPRGKEIYYCDPNSVNSQRIGLVPLDSELMLSPYGSYAAMVTSPKPGETKIETFSKTSGYKDFTLSETLTPVKFASANFLMCLDSNKSTIFIDLKTGNRTTNLQQSQSNQDTDIPFQIKNGVIFGSPSPKGVNEIKIPSLEGAQFTTIIKSSSDFSIISISTDGTLSLRKLEKTNEKLITEALDKERKFIEARQKALEIAQALDKYVEIYGSEGVTPDVFKERMLSILGSDSKAFDGLTLNTQDGKVFLGDDIAYIDEGNYRILIGVGITQVVPKTTDSGE